MISNAQRPVLRRLVILHGLAVLLAGEAAFPADEPQGPERWESSIRKFEEQDAESPPPKNAILFAGSSSIRLWDLSKSFPERVTVNRGFGGSIIADSIHFADRAILKHKPRIVVLYAGDNDIFRASKSADEVFDDYRKFVATIHAELPRTRIVFISIKPSIARWKAIDTIRRVNGLIAAHCKSDERLDYADVFTPMLGGDGKPRGELFVKDGLHLSDEGYKLWTAVVDEYLK